MIDTSKTKEKSYLQSSEGVHGIRPQVTFDVMCNSPYVL